MTRDCSSGWKECKDRLFHFLYSLVFADLIDYRLILVSTYTLMVAHPGPAFQDLDEEEALQQANGPHTERQKEES